MVTNKVKLAITLVQNILEDIKSGRCTEDEINEYINSLPIKDNKLCTTECCKILNMSKSAFEKRVERGTINKGIKVAGKAPYWDREYIESLIKKKG